jgi:hypothetical protein
MAKRRQMMSEREEFDPMDEFSNVLDWADENRELPRQEVGVRKKSIELPQGFDEDPLIDISQ